MADDQTKFYVYAIKADGVIRYIGKGTAHRLASHMTCLRKRVTRDQVHARMIEAEDAGATITGVKLIAGLTNGEARKLEWELVRSTEGLWNIAPGGGGGSSDMALRSWADPEKKASRLAKVMTDERRAQISEQMRELNARPGFKERRAEAIRKRFAEGRYDTKARMVACVANGREALKSVEKMRETRQAQARTPEGRAELSKRAKDAWAAGKYANRKSRWR